MIKRLTGAVSLITAIIVLMLVVFAYVAINNSVQHRTASIKLAESNISQLYKRTKLYSVGGGLDVLMLTELATLEELADGLQGDEKEVIQSMRSRMMQTNDNDHTAPIIQAVSSLAGLLERSTRLSKYIVWIGWFLLPAYLILVILPLISKLGKTVEVEQEAKKESADIMGTVNEGLFLLTPEGEIGLEQSKSLRKLFRIERDLDGNFFDFIRNYVTQKTANTAREYFELLQKKRLKPKLIKDLNPLQEVEISIVRRDGGFDNRYLDFEFNRVDPSADSSDVLVSVTDVTKQVLLGRELEATREGQEAQMKLLVHMLSLNPETLNRFVEGAEAGLEEINQVLELGGHSDSDLRGKLTPIATRAHQIKGDAAALGLHGFEFAIHDFESNIANLRESKSSLDGKALLPAVEALKLCFSEIDKIRGIGGRLSDYAGPSQERENISEAHSSRIVTQLKDLAATLQNRSEAKAKISTLGFAQVDLNPELEDSLASVGVQLLRNSLAHGFQSVEKRIEAGKSDFLNVTVSLHQAEDQVYFTFRDDGEGINREAVIKRANELGIINTHRTDIAVGKLIFHPQFSSREKVDLEAGRGVGLSSVYEIVKSLGGIIKLSQSPGNFCQFQIRVPVDTVVREEVEHA